MTNVEPFSASLPIKSFLVFKSKDYVPTVVKAAKGAAKKTQTPQPKKGRNKQLKAAMQANEMEKYLRKFNSSEDKNIEITPIVSPPSTPVIVVPAADITDADLEDLLNDFDEPMDVVEYTVGNPDDVGVFSEPEVDKEDAEKKVKVVVEEVKTPKEQEIKVALKSNNVPDQFKNASVEFDSFVEDIIEVKLERKRTLKRKKQMPKVEVDKKKKNTEEEEEEKSVNSKQKKSKNPKEEESEKSSDSESENSSEEEASSSESDSTASAEETKEKKRAPQKKVEPAKTKAKGNKNEGDVPKEAPKSKEKPQKAEEADETEENQGGVADDGMNQSLKLFSQLQSEESKAKKAKGKGKRKGKGKAAADGNESDSESEPDSKPKKKGQKRKKEDEGEPEENPKGKKKQRGGKQEKDSQNGEENGGTKRAKANEGGAKKKTSGINKVKAAASAVLADACKDKTAHLLSLGKEPNYNPFLDAQGGWLPVDEIRKIVLDTMCWVALNLTTEDKQRIPQPFEGKIDQANSLDTPDFKNYCKLMYFAFAPEDWNRLQHYTKKQGKEEKKVYDF